MVSFLIIKSHLVDTNSDVAVIWGYKPNTTFDFFIYFLVYAICCFLSIFLFGSKYKFIDIIVYLVLFLCTCFFADSILASMEFDWPMNYSPKALI